MNISQLINPLSSDEFFSEFWGRKHVHISGQREKFEVIPNVTELPGILAGDITQEGWRNTHNLEAQAYKQNRDGSLEKYTNVPISMYTQMFNSGYGLCFNDVSFAIPSFQELLRDFSTEKVNAAQDLVTCYLTPPHSTGLLHFDYQHVFFLQRSGSKTWRISTEPGKKNPIENLIYSATSSQQFEALSQKGYRIKLPSECGYLDLTLEEGDLLYMPPGYYHLGNTTESLSFHYTVTLFPISYHTQIYSLIHERSRKHSEYLNQDLRFKDPQEAQRIIEDSHKLFSEIIDRSLIDELGANPRGK